MKKIILLLLLSSSLYAGDIKGLLSGNFGYYPDSKILDNNESIIKQSYSYGFSAGLSIYNDFMFIVDFFIDEPEWEKNFVNDLRKISGYLGFKNVLFSYNRQVFKVDDFLSLWMNSELGNKNFVVSTTEISYDLSSFMDVDYIGFYLGAVYQNYVGPIIDENDFVKLINFNGFGISLYMDTLNRHLLNGINTIMIGNWIPWVNLGLRYTIGPHEYENKQSILGIVTLQGIFGLGYTIDTKFVDFNFSAGYNVVLFLSPMPIFNSGIIAKVSLSL